MEIGKINNTSTSEALGDYSGIMLRAIRELEQLKARREQLSGRNYCGVLYSTEDPREAPGLRAAIMGVCDYFNSPDVEGVVAEFKSTEAPYQWHYGVDIQWF